jgi:MOSC domain-containing protein YiiM
MNVLSVNVGKAEPLETNKGIVDSGIRKRPIATPRRVKIRELGLEGDQQADTVNHGGVNKAVYIYPHAHYPAWCELLKRDDLPFGYLGENLTVEGLDEETACIGDRLKIGTAELVVRSPRLPCFKLVGLTRSPRAALFMLTTKRTGIYLSVHTPGDVGIGDAIELLHRDPRKIPVARYVDVMMNRAAPGMMDQLLAHDELPTDRRDLLQKRVASGYDGRV